MNIYQAKSKKLGATRYSEVIKQARRMYHDIEKQTKRKPYIRSAYFHKEKIFFDYFWPHLDQKSFIDRRKRLRYFPCAVELIQNSRHAPLTKQNPNRKDELLHRFAGMTSDEALFYVNIKEDTKTKQKYFMSVFTPE